MNPILLLWEASLIFLGVVLGVVLFPFLLVFTGPATALALLARLARVRREARYSWAVPDSKVSQSGYRRRRYGRWS